MKRSVIRSPSIIITLYVFLLARSIHFGDFSGPLPIQVATFLYSRSPRDNRVQYLQSQLTVIAKTPAQESDQPRLHQSQDGQRNWIQEALIPFTESTFWKETLRY